jgi:transcriptional regulator
MHPNPVFDSADTRQNLEFARERGFGVLALGGPGAPLLAHVPFVVAPDGGSLDLHLMRSNPVARALREPRPAVIAVSGPDGYVSPDWYGVDDQVPTWNYVAVHLTGRLEVRPDRELRGLLDRLSATFEERLLPKQPWDNTKMDAEALSRLMRMIVPCRLRIDAIDGTWKLSQNKPGAVRLRAADHVRAQGIGAASGDLAALMRGIGES